MGYPPKKTEQVEEKTEYFTHNTQIEDIGLEYIGHFNRVRFIVYFENGCIEIPQKRIGEFLELFDDTRGDGQLMLHTLKGRYLRVTTEDSCIGRYCMLQHIVKDKSYIIPENEERLL